MATNLSDVKLDWQPILQAGATKLLEAFGTAVGGPLGAAAINALLGKQGTNADFQVEIVEGLKRIEQKIDTLTTFIQKELPDLIAVKVEAALLESTFKELQSRCTALSAAIAGFDNSTKPSEFEVDNVRDSADALAVVGEKLLRYGPAWAHVGVYTLSALISAYGRLAPLDPKKFTAILGVYAKSFAAIAADWFNDTRPYSYTRQLKVLNEAADDYKLVLSNIPKKRFVLCYVDLTGLIFASENIKKNPYRAIPAYFKKGPDGLWTGDFNPTGLAVKKPAPKIFDSEAPSWHTVRIGVIGKQEMWAIWGKMLQRVNDAERNSKSIPPRIASVEELKSIAAAVLATCGTLDDF